MRVLRGAAAAGNQVGEEHARRVSTGTLNAVIRDAVSWKNPPLKSGRAGRVYYVTQAARAAPRTRPAAACQPHMRTPPACAHDHAQHEEGRGRPTAPLPCRV